MKWFNKERLKGILTFPVETVNLLHNGEECVDQDWFDFVCEMDAEGHSFFIYLSDSVDSLASCCFDGKQKCLSRSSDGVNYMTFEELYEAPYNNTKRNFKVFHNGSWVDGKIIRLPKRQMYKITTSNKKELLVTDNHIFPTISGDKFVKDLTTEDYLLFNCRRLDAIPERDKNLTYDQGFLIGMYLGDGSIYLSNNNHNTPQISLSLNENKYIACKNKLENAVNKIDSSTNIYLNTPYNNVYPVAIRSWAIHNFIREYVKGNYCYEKELDLSCLEQSYDFRLGILEGFYATDGGNSNRIYTTSPKLSEQIECLITSLGLSSVIDVVDRTNEKCVIRGVEYNRNYPLYCIRWYSSTNKRTFGGDYRVINNCEYRRITSIEPYDTDSDYVYCFEMTSKDEPYFTLPNGVITHNCRLRNGITDNTFSYTLGAGGISTGSKSVMTINLNRLVQNVKRANQNATLADISEAVREQVKKIHKYQIAFNEIVKGNFKAKLLPIYDAGFISLEKQYLTVGINGFVEAAEFLGIDISPNDKYFEFGEAILKPIYEENKAAKTDEVMFNTEFVPAENLGVKNAKWDKKDGYFVPRDCYNSYFYKVEDKTCSVLDKFILHGDKLTKYLDGGSALHCNLDEHLTKEQYRKLIRFAIKTGCTYFTFNIPNTICNDCGFITKHYVDKCPKCNSENVDYATRVIGYLKRISRFSEARIKEANQRYYADAEI